MRRVPVPREPSNLAAIELENCAAWWMAQSGGAGATVHQDQGFAIHVCLANRTCPKGHHRLRQLLAPRRLVNAGADPAEDRARLPPLPRW
jgi:hypothetical protein